VPRLTRGEARRRRRILLPFLADSYVVEAVASLLGLAGFLIGYILHESATKRWGIPIVIGLLTTVVFEQFIERAQARSRTGRLEKIEAALTDREVFNYIGTVTDSYKLASEQREKSKHSGLYVEATADLLDGNEWKNLAEGRIEISDPKRELPIASELLPTAAVQVRAIAVPDDLDYLESEAGREYLSQQAARIKKPVRLRIERLFVYSSRDAHRMKMEVAELVARIEQAAGEHSEAKVTCRILDLDQIGYADVVPDINIYDDHTVRYSFRQLGDGEMQAFVSENETDIRRQRRLFDFLWMHGRTYPSAPASTQPSPG
jgi:hypothetical protein